MWLIGNWGSEEVVDFRTNAQGTKKAPEAKHSGTRLRRLREKDAGSKNQGPVLNNQRLGNVA